MQTVRVYLTEHSVLDARIIEGQEEAGAKFTDYFNYSERSAVIPSHRLLALLRGRRENILNVTLRLDSEEEKPKWDAPFNPCESQIAAYVGIANKGRAADKWLIDTVRWSWRIKIFTHLETELMTQLREQAEMEAIRVFSLNLKALLLAAPAGSRVTMGLDPRHSYRR